MTTRGDISVENFLNHEIKRTPDRGIRLVRELAEVGKMGMKTRNLLGDVKFVTVDHRFAQDAFVRVFDGKIKFFQTLE